MPLRRCGDVPRRAYHYRTSRRGLDVAFFHEITGRLHRHSCAFEVDTTSRSGGLRYLHSGFKRTRKAATAGGNAPWARRPWDEVGGPRSLPRDIEGHDVE